VSLHHHLQAVIEVGDILLLVMERDDDGVLGHGVFIIDRKAVLSCRFSVLSWVPRSARRSWQNGKIEAWMIPSRHSPFRRRMSS
jgi:hypothetical protein